MQTIKNQLNKKKNKNQIKLLKVKQLINSNKIKNKNNNNSNNSNRRKKRNKKSLNKKLKDPQQLNIVIIKQVLNTLMVSFNGNQLMKSIAFLMFLWGILNPILLTSKNNNYKKKSRTDKNTS